MNVKLTLRSENSIEIGLKMYND